MFIQVKEEIIREDPLLPVNNYAWSKLGGEAVCKCTQIL